MKLTEIIQVKKSKELSLLCYLAKNLYNVANFHYRQFFFHLDEFINYYDLQVILKDHKTYKILPAQTSQQILRLVIKNWKSYWKKLKDYLKDKSTYLGRPKMPNYKRKNGQSIAIFTNQNSWIKNGYIQFPKSVNLPPIKTRIKQHQQIRILPRGSYYIIEIIYNQQEQNLHLDKSRILSIDLGINNLITTANNIRNRHLIVKGTVLKAINQWYNKVRGINRSFVVPSHPETMKMNVQTKKRNNKIKDYFHKASHMLINYSQLHNIGTIIIGYNKEWKQNSNMGKKITKPLFPSLTLN